MSESDPDSDEDMVLPDTRLSRRLDVNEVHFMHSCTTVFGEHTVDAALRNTVPNR
jgi:hypothetical protein